MNKQNQLITLTIGIGVVLYRASEHQNKTLYFQRIILGKLNLWC